LRAAQTTKRIKEKKSLGKKEAESTDHLGPGRKRRGQPDSFSYHFGERRKSKRKEGTIN